MFRRYFLGFLSVFSICAVAAAETPFAQSVSSIGVRGQQQYYALEARMKALETQNAALQTDLQSALAFINTLGGSSCGGGFVAAVQENGSVACGSLPAPPPPPPTVASNTPNPPPTTTGGGFDETNYLKANPDVALAIATAQPGDYWYDKDAKHHYQKFGVEEGRTANGSSGWVDFDNIKSHGISRDSDANANLKKAADLLINNADKLSEDSPWHDFSESWGKNSVVGDDMAYTDDGCVTGNGRTSCVNP